MESQEELWVVSCLQHAPLDNSVRTIRALNRNQSQKDWFFCVYKSSIKKRKDGTMVNIIKGKFLLEES